MYRPLAFAAVATFLSATASANNYPDRPITLIVPFAAGGFADATARLVSEGLERELKQPIVVSNRPGAGGNIGTSAVARAAPDGYTLLMALPSHVVQPEADRILGQTPAYQTNEFAPIARVSMDSVVLFGGPTVAGKSLGDIVELARNQPDELTYSSSGRFANTQLSMQIFANATDTRFRHVPYQGAGPAMMAVLGEQVDLSTAGPATVAGQLEGGRLVPLAILGNERNAVLPDVPTAQELGYDAEYYVWSALFAPAGTPDDILQTLSQAVEAMTQNPDFLAAMAKANNPVAYLGGREFAEFLNAEEALLTETVQSIRD